MKRALLLILALVLTLSGCQPSSDVVVTPPGNSQGGNQPPDPIEQIISGMTLRQKVGQLLFIGFPDPNEGNNQAILSSIQPGGILLTTWNITDIPGTIRSINAYRQNPDLALPPFVGVDQEGGRISRLPEAWATRFPSAATVGRDPEKSKQLAEYMGEELAALGFNLDFAPVLDINSNPRNPIIGDRSFGATPEQVWRAAKQVISGLTEAGIIPVVKHFPGHGDTSVDSHKALPTVTASKTELEQRELAPFRQAVQQQVPAVMIGHLLVPALDPEHPSSLSPAIITGLLREQWGYQGVVMTDDLEMRAIAQDNIGEAAVQSLQAGVDVLLVGHTYAKQQAVLSAVLAAVEKGEITEERIDQSLRRIIALKQQFAVGTEPCDPEAALRVLGTAEHRRAAAEIGK